ncbi:MAG: hypothetical protein HYR94_07865 [Chloroflexi bacterium]|nr:hypothetical protein [Chloroflexota bacterium]
MAKKVIAQVEFEIGQIEELLEAYSDLVERANQSEPNLIEITALASVLHSFYNGLENIFLSIAKGVDKDVPTGLQWHRDLLNQMAQSTSSRDPVLTLETAHQLADYLGFRHFFRHSYSFFLDWTEMAKLILSLSKVWVQIKAELQFFLDKLDSNQG